MYFERLYFFLLYFTRLVLNLTESLYRVFYTHMRFKFVLPIILFSLNTMALSFEGRVSKSKSRISFFDITNDKNYKLVGSTSIISKYLKKLSDGDFISIDGTKSEQLNTLTVNSVNYFGLKTLLGTWIGDDAFCYNFTSFTEFSISQSISGEKCAPVFEPTYTYFVNPSTTSWVMLLAGERGSYVGDLLINSPKDIQIQLYDSETGDILRKIYLRK